MVAGFIIAVFPGAPETVDDFLARVLQLLCPLTHLRFQNLVEVAVAVVEDPDLQQVANPANDFGNIKRFAEKVACAGGQRSLPDCGVIHGGQYQNRNIGIGLHFLQLFHDAKAVQLRHVEVQQNQFGFFLLVDTEDFLGVLGAEYIGVAFLAQNLLEQHHVGGLVVDNQNL